MSEYNGWTNWATWNAALWATGDEANFQQWAQAARLYSDDIDALADYLEQQMPTWTNLDMDENDWADVNWEEIAQACIEENN
jgi:hypothetical protein